MHQINSLSAGCGPRTGTGYSAAIPAAPATCRKAASTRASNPGLFGAKGVSKSLVRPAACAARKMRFRRSRNCEALTGSPKSATLTAHALSYAVHSGDSSSGVSSNLWSFGGISLAFSGVGSSQRYNPQAVVSQNINEDVKPTVQEAPRDEALFTVVVAVIKEHLRRGPVKARRVAEMQPAFSKVLRGFVFGPFELPRHKVVPHTKSSDAQYHERNYLIKLYIFSRALWITCCAQHLEYASRASA